MTLSYWMVENLRDAMGRPDGEVVPADNDVLKGLLRWGLSRQAGGKVYITEAGSWAAAHARVDPRTKPSLMTDDEWRACLTRLLRG